MYCHQLEFTRRQMSGQVVQGGFLLWLSTLGRSLFSSIGSWLGQDHWIFLSFAYFFACCLAPPLALYDGLKASYKRLSPGAHFVLNSGAILFIGCWIWVIYLCLEYEFASNNIWPLYRIETRLMLPKNSYVVKKTTNNLDKCMRYCLDKHGCIDGFHDPALSKDNCFLFGAPPFYFGHTPIPSPTATTFIKKSKMELRGAQIEQAKEDSLYYHMSTDVVRYADMEDYCRHENDLYYPAIMGLNNSAYQVARRYSYRLRRGDHPRRHQGLLFLMAIGYPDSHAQYDLARGYAFVGKDSSNRQRLLRFVFYDNGMLEFLSDVFKKRRFFVLCQADPLNLRGDNMIQRTLFHVPTVRGKSLS